MQTVRLGASAPNCVLIDFSGALHESVVAEIIEGSRGSKPMDIHSGTGAGGFLGFQDGSEKVYTVPSHLTS